jgi:3-deoxy-D-manno-octulosonate 8-phosphate phosphatase (KDO 8-P phosphatase)
MAPATPAELAARCQEIELLVTDVDGVLTDGVIAIDGHGLETKHFHVRDGLGFAVWHLAGKEAAILSGRQSVAVEHRAAELKIAHVLQAREQKADSLRTLIDELGLSPRQVCFMGDDLPDLPALLISGLAVCPADAAVEVKHAADFVTRARGGQGAVREVVELILKSQGKWNDLIQAAFAAPVFHVECESESQDSTSAEGIPSPSPLP